MKQLFPRFDWKCVLHNQDEKLVSCSLKNWEKSVKTGFMQESLSKRHFSKILHVLLTLTSLFENEIFVEKQILKIVFNPHTSLTLVQNFTLTLLRSISKAQMWKSLLKWLFDKLSCVKPVLTNFSQFLELHETNFLSWLWRTYFRSNLKKYLSKSNGTCFIVI